MRDRAPCTRISGLASATMNWPARLQHDAAPGEIVMGGQAIQCPGSKYPGSSGPGQCRRTSQRADEGNDGVGNASRLDGDVADISIVAALSGAGIALFIVELDAPGVTRSPLTSIDPTRSQARLDFKRAAAQLLAADGWPVLVAALDRVAVLTAFEQIGGAERSFGLSPSTLLRTGLSKPLSPSTLRRAQDRPSSGGTVYTFECQVVSGVVTLQQARPGLGIFPSQLGH